MHRFYTHLWPPSRNRTMIAKGPDQNMIQPYLVKAVDQTKFYDHEIYTVSTATYRPPYFYSAFLKQKLSRCLNTQYNNLLTYGH